MYEITQGKDHSKGIKVVIYGVEGIGKTTLASKFPDPLFIDTEGSTTHFDNIKRLPKPKDWKDLNAMIDFISAEAPCRTLVIDTFDWAEMEEIQSMLVENGWDSIERPGYGKGYTMSAERIAAFLKDLENKLINIGINVVLTCHAQIKSFENPEEAGKYDRYELKLGQKTGSKTAPLVKEWPDLMLFCNFKTYVEKSSADDKKAKAVGGTERMMFATHTAVWDAKNRFGLPDEMPMDFKPIAHIFKKEAPKKEKPKKEKAKKDNKDFVIPTYEDLLIPEEVPQDVKDLCKKESIYADDIQAMLYAKKIVKEKGFNLAKVPSKFWTSFVKEYDTRWKAAIEQAKMDNLPF